MATLSSKAIQPMNFNDAFFRAWSKFIFDGLIAGGWVQTADTGQINFATVTEPTAANQTRGYIIVRMDDTQQATTPIYVKFDFGSGASADGMGVWITVGGGSDGAGAITPKYYENPTSGSPLFKTASFSGSITNVMSFISAGTNRVHVCIGIDMDAANQANALFFSLERTLTGSGQPDGMGVVLIYADNANSINRSLLIHASQIPPQAVQQGVAHIHSLLSPSANSHNVGGSVIFPFDGLAQQPITGVLRVRAGDFRSSIRMTIQVYGQPVVYQGLFSYHMTYETQDSAGVALMRFD